MGDNGWEEFYEASMDEPPHKLLIEALRYCESYGRALDLGCGTFRDSKLLLNIGFSVDAVDSNPRVREIREENLSDREELNLSVQKFSECEFKEEYYDLVNAQYSIPFASIELSKLMQQVLDSLNEEGVFVGQFFGVRDEWNTEGDFRRFLKMGEVKAIFSDVELIKFNEVEEDRPTSEKQDKHWHYFEVIARK